MDQNQQRNSQRHSTSSKRTNSDSSSSDLGLSMEQLVGQVLFYLQTISARTITKLEEPIWKAKLLKYPVWKLQRLVDEYTGPFNNKVLEYLDGIQIVPYHEPLRMLPDPEDEPTEIGLLMREHASKIMMLSKREAEAYERDFLKKMREKYPDSEWTPALRLNRNAERYPHNGNPCEYCGEDPTAVEFGPCPSRMAGVKVKRIGKDAAAG